MSKKDIKTVLNTFLNWMGLIEIINIASLDKAVDYIHERLSKEPVDNLFDNIDNRIQYADIDSAIKAHADTYSFNIESRLFNQLSKEQQELWRTEIEQAVVSGGEMGYELSKDKRYNENRTLSDKDMDQAAKDYARFDDYYDVKEYAAFKSGVKWHIAHGWKFIDNASIPQLDREKKYCVYTNAHYIVATVINHPNDDDLLQWRCTEFPFNRYVISEGDRYMLIET